MVVDADHSHTQTFRHPFRFVPVFRPYARRQAVAGIVRHLHCLFQRVDDHDGQHRTKGNIPHDVHIVVGAGQEGGGIESAGTVGNSRATQDLRAACHSVNNVFMNGVTLLLDRHGADIHLRVVRVAHPQRPAHRSELLQELLRYGTDHVDPLDADSHLAGV